MEQIKLPLRISDNFDTRVITDDLIIFSESQNKDYAARIVQAVNNYEELLTLLRAVANASTDESLYRLQMETAKPLLRRIEEQSK